MPESLGSSRPMDGQISNVKATGTGAIGAPILIKRQVKITMTVTEGEVRLIGGLNDVQSTDCASRWSLLPSSWGGQSRSLCPRRTWC